MASSVVKPEKRILDHADIESFKKSKAYADIVSFILILNDKTRSLPFTNEITSENQTVLILLEWLDSLLDLIKKIPAEKIIPGRFGNVSFRVWLVSALELSNVMLKDQLKILEQPACELISYLGDSFGNSVRIDYGTGHELHFVAFLCGLSKLELLSLVRNLQSSYTMEPAGSRGVWGLDDFQFMPYLWGSSQLIGSDIPVSSIASAKIDKFTTKYLFFDAINYIYQSKRGSFSEHSPILFNMAALSDWQRVNKGLWKMYLAEVLHKFVVVQHFLFGTLLSYDIK